MNAPDETRLASFRAASYRTFTIRNIAQLRLVLRAQDYGVATAIWLECDAVRAAGYAQTAACLARLAFTELVDEGIVDAHGKDIAHAE